ncbi:hypothetical protein DFJ73DRAFT_766728 [Zopfochytrium polystomum]|nr:hypothetical protein DFJ73DRAFT_766728 [Zopfochytrium polystomum]
MTLQSQLQKIKSQINNSLRKGIVREDLEKTAQAAERKKDQLEGEDALSITSMTKKAAEFPSIEAELEDDEESCWENFFPGPGCRLASFTLKKLEGTAHKNEMKILPLILRKDDERETLGDGNEEGGQRHKPAHENEMKILPHHV